MKTRRRPAAKRKRPFRPRKSIYDLPPLELECMKALWALGEATVRDIRQQLAAARRPLAYTTVETIMDRLTRKGAVARSKRGRAHLYTVLYEQSVAREQGVQAVVDHFFNGSRRALQGYLSGQPVPGGNARPRPVPPDTARARSAPRTPAAARRQERRPATRSSHRPTEPPLDTTLL